MHQEKNIFWREAMWPDSVTLPLVFFALGNRPHYGNRLERTQYKEAYMEL